ncbi:MAG: DUF5674 family protein [bacterium]
MTEIIKEKIDHKQLTSFLGQPFDEMIKFVVDIDKKMLALGGEMHADQEQLLLENGSVQTNLWGGNIYPNKQTEDRLEFTSLINIRPAQDNPAMEIQSPALREQIKVILNGLLKL